MKRWGRRRWLAFPTIASLYLLLLITALGCSSRSGQDGSGGSLGTVTSEVIVCSTRAYTDSDGAPRAEREFYVLPAINNELRLHSELARELGIQSVSDCAGARAFSKGRYEYSLTHAGFDATDPLEPRLLTPPVRPRNPRPTFEVAKILGGGGPAQDKPVVRLIHRPRSDVPADSGAAAADILCTGTFIAKDWIATAAHCLATGVAPGVNPNDPLNPEFHGWYQWQIDFADSSGQPAPQPTPSRSLKTLALQFPDPRFRGFNPDLVQITPADHDFALLYLDGSEDDRFLPPDPDEGTTVIASTVAPNPNQQGFIYGWGNPTPSISRTGPMPPFVLSELAIIGQLASSSDALPCKGDSGGPAFQILTIGGPGQQQNKQVLIGILHGIQTLREDPDGGSPTCAGFDQVGEGDALTWARIDTEIDWIEKAMRFYNGPQFSCGRLVAEGTAAAAARCWGSSCKQDTDCSANQACSKPGDALVAPCPICGNQPVQSCDCVFGQCLPK